MCVYIVIRSVSTTSVYHITNATTASQQYTYRRYYDLVCSVYCTVHSITRKNIKIKNKVSDKIAISAKIYLHITPIRLVLSSYKFMIKFDDYSSLSISMCEFFFLSTIHTIVKFLIFILFLRDPLLLLCCAAHEY